MSKKKRKYGNKKIEVDGHIFDSLMEAEYYFDLVDLKREGKIKDFSLQPKFILQEKFKKFDENYRAITYSADFEVVNNDDSAVVIDIKGMRTSTFNLKKKLFEKKFPQRLLLVTKCPDKYNHIFGNWITLEDLEQLRKENRKKKKEKK